MPRPTHDEVLDNLIADIDDDDAQKKFVRTSDAKIDALWQAVIDALNEPLDPME